MDAYDVIIVGSGSTGGALAARLTEDATRSVLVLEAGPTYTSPDGFPDDLHSPGTLAGIVPNHPHNWAYPAEMRPGVVAPYPRGRGMGGSSAINGCYFTRGLPADFDGWRALGNDGWGFSDVLPYFRRLESDQDFAGAVHGDTGPIPVVRETLDRVPEFTTAFDTAAKTLGFAHDPDKNDPRPEGGFGPQPLNMADGRRVGTAHAYLMPALGRPNLTVLGGAAVTRVLFTGTRAMGVEAVVDGRVVEFRGGEVVVSTGALRTPTVLMHSGIGPAAHLAEHGVDLLVDLPGVGANLVDHPMVHAMWHSRLRLPTMLDRGAMTSVLHWVEEGSHMEVLPFVAKGSDMAIVDDPAIRAAMAAGPDGSMIAITAMREESRGSVTLGSGDPTDLPVIRWNLLNSAVDRSRCRAAVRTSYALFRTDPMQAVGIEIEGLGPRQIEDDAELDAFVAARIGCGHPCGTARMGPADDPTAVVDQQLRVRGVQGLRVADTSVFPTIPMRGPSATAVMLGERLADLMDRG